MVQRLKNIPSPSAISADLDSAVLNSLIDDEIFSSWEEITIAETEGTKDDSDWEKIGLQDYSTDLEVKKFLLAFCLKKKIKNRAK